MSKKTTNFEFIKPELTDVPDITVTNPNWDNLDQVLKSNFDAINNEMQSLSDGMTQGYEYINQQFETFSEEFNQALDGVTGSYLVTFTGTATDGYTADRTLNEVREAHNNNYRVYAQDSSGRVFNLVIISSLYAQFTSVKGSEIVSVILAYDNTCDTAVIKTGGKRTSRFVVGTSTNGWTSSDCDYLCDGTADEEEINAAIAALPSTGGEVVLLDGSYNLTGAILVEKQYVTLSGSGASTKLVRAFGATELAHALVIADEYYITIKDLYFDGKKSTYTESYNTNLRIGASGYYNMVQNCFMMDCAGAGIDCAGYYTNIHGNYISGCGKGIETSFGDHLSITGNVVRSGNNGIYLYGSENAVCSGNSIYNCTYGINMQSNDNATVTGNSIQGGTSGIYLSLCKYCTISANNIHGENQYGIVIGNDGCVGNVVKANACENNTLGAIYDFGTDTKLDAPTITSGMTDLVTGESQMISDYYFVYE